MKKLAIALVMTSCTVLATASPAQTETPSAPVQFIAQPMPKFPSSERDREGWVVLDSTIDDDGVVVDVSIKDSSGSDAFNEAALHAVREWRFDLDEGRHLTVLLNFVFKRRRVHLSRKFFRAIQKVYKSIDEGRLDDAEERINAIRDNDDLTAFELAYSLIAEGRAANERGDKVEQLRLFRRAVINHGRWLERGKYLKLLHAIVVLEIQQHEFTSALRDYELLTETGPGRAIAADIGEPILAVRKFLASSGDFPPPYVVASMEVTVEREASVLAKDIEFREDYFGESEEPVRPEQQ